MDPSKGIITKSSKAIGSVLHVFSHVKKTFQVVVIRLENGPNAVNGSSPPEVLKGEWLNDESIDGETGPKSKKRKKAQEDEEGEIRWVSEESVSSEK